MATHDIALLPLLPLVVFFVFIDFPPSTFCAPPLWLCFFAYRQDAPMKTPSAKAPMRSGELELDAIKAANEREVRQFSTDPWWEAYEALWRRYKTTEI